MKIAIRRGDRAASPPPLDQAHLRSRRRQSLGLTYTGAFSLAAEVEAITAPLAERVATEPRPEVHVYAVRAVADAVAEVVSFVVGAVAERDGRAKVRHLPSNDQRRALAALRAITPRPAVPEIDGADLAAGEWSGALINYAAQATPALADLLASAYPPGAPELRGAPALSDRLVKVLRVLDGAATTLTRRLDLAATTRASAPPSRSGSALTPDQAARRVLDELGVAP